MFPGLVAKVEWGIQKVGVVRTQDATPRMSDHVSVACSLQLWLVYVLLTSHALQTQSTLAWYANTRTLGLSPIPTEVFAGSDPKVDGSVNATLTGVERVWGQGGPGLVARDRTASTGTPVEVGLPAGGAVHQAPLQLRSVGGRGLQGPSR